MGGYDPDAIGDLEARLLAVERRTMQLDGDLRTLRRGAIETQQRIRDAWGDLRLRGPVVVATPAVVSCATVTVSLKNCNGFAALGAGGTVTITSAGGTVYGPATTNSSGQCSIGLPTSGTYTISADYPNYFTTTASLSFTCTAKSVSLSMKQCDTAVLLAAYPTLTCTMGGQAFTLVGAMSGSTLQYTPTGGDADFSSASVLQFDSGGACFIAAGTASVAPLFSCSVAGASVGCMNFSYTFWWGTCSGTNAVAHTNSNLGTAAVNSTLSSYSTSPFNAAFTLNSSPTGVPGLAPIQPFTGSVAISP